MMVDDLSANLSLTSLNSETLPSIDQTPGAARCSHHLGCGTRSPLLIFAQWPTDSPVARDICVAEILANLGRMSLENTS